MAKKKFFGQRIDPACEYCESGQPLNKNNMILCKYKGVVAPYFSCRKFDYSPLKRIPKPPLNLPDYSPDDFKL